MQRLNDKRIRRIGIAPWMCLVTGFSLLLTGCEEFGGGAKYDARVVVLDAGHFSSEEVASESEATESTTEATTADATTGGFGTFAGRLVMQGTAPSLPLLIAQGAEVKDKEVCAAVDVPDERLQVGANGGVANAFIYLKRAPKGGKDAQTTGEPLIFDQKNCRFIPHCMIVPTGVTIKVLSDDPIAHNTHNYPKRGTSVNSGVAPNDREGKLTISYRSAEDPVSVKCDYHAWMQAWHLPVDHPYASVTDENGNFSIPDLPAGKHEFTVWHEAADGGFITKKLAVTIAGGQTEQMDIEFPTDKLALN